MSVPELKTNSWDSVMEHTNGQIRPLTRFDPQKFLGKRGFKYLTPATRYILSATRLALRDAKLEIDAHAPEEKGVILGTNFAVHDVTKAMDDVILSEGADALRPMESPNFSINLPASYISVKYQFQAFNITLTGMLTAGLEAVILGADSIRKGRARMVLAGATEGTPPKRLGPLLSRGSVAEGAACALCLESLSAAQQRHARIYASIEKATLWFIPPRIIGRAEAHLHVERLFHRYLDQTLETSHHPQLIYLVGADTPLCQYAQSCIQQYLEAQKGSTEYQFYVKQDMAEATVSPLLHLATIATLQRRGLIVGVSPLGHVVMLYIDSPAP